jgi:hypothetical protein
MVDSAEAGPVEDLLSQNRARIVANREADRVEAEALEATVPTSQVDTPTSLNADRIRAEEDTNPDIQNESFQRVVETSQNDRSQEVVDRLKKNEQSFASSLAEGAAKGAIDSVNEIDKFFNLSGSLKKNFGVDIQLGEDTLFYDSEKDLGLTTDNTTKAITSVLTQFLLPFGAVSKGVQVLSKLPKLSKMFGIINGSKKLKGASIALQGALVDVAAFNPKDPNAGNLLLMSSFISEDLRGRAIIEKLLATDPNDSDGVNRVRNAMTGIFAGALTSGLLKGGGHVLGRATKFNEKIVAKTVAVDEATAKAYKEGAEEAAKDLTDGFMELHKKGDVEEITKVSSALRSGDPSLSGVEPEDIAGIPFKKGNKIYEAPDRKMQTDYETELAHLSDAERDSAIAIVQKVLKGEAIDITDAKLPFNLNKVLTSGDILQTTFALGRLIRETLPRATTRASLPNAIEDFATTFGIDPKLFGQQVARVTTNVDEAIDYVQGAKIVSTLQVKRLLAEGDKFIKAPQSAEATLAWNTQLLETLESLRATSGFGTAAGRLLAEHKMVAKLGSITQQNDAIRMNLLQTMMDVSKDGAKVRASRMLNLDAKNALQTEALQKRLGREDKLFKGKDQAAQTKRILEADSYQLRGMANYVNQGAYARTKDALLEIYINGLLSNPKTFAVNAFGNISAMATSIFERGVAGIKNTKLDGVHLKESQLLVNGFFEGVMDTWTVFSKAWKEGPSSIHIKTDFTKPHQRFLTKEVFNAGGWLGGAIDLLGKTVNIPGKLLVSADEVFKNVNYQGQRKSLAYRKAMRTLGKRPENNLERTELAELQAKYLNDEEVLQQSSEFAKINTFTNDLFSKEVIDPITGKIKEVSGFTKKFQQVIEADPTGAMRVYIPFFKTPANLLRFAAQRNPGFAKSTMSQVLKDELTSGDLAIKQLAQAKAHTGQALVSTAFYMAYNGMFTGPNPSDNGLRQTLTNTGWAPFSYFNAEDKTFRPLNRMDPLDMLFEFGGILGVSAKSLVALNGENEETGLSKDLFNRYQNVMGDGVLAFARIVTDRHYLQGFATVLDAFRGDSYAMSKLGRDLGGIIPTNGFYSSLRRGLDRTGDPAKKSRAGDDFQLDRKGSVVIQSLRLWLDGAKEELLRGIPGYDLEQSNQYNLVGEPTFYPGNDANQDLWTGMFHNLLNPLATQELTKDPLLLKMAELGISLEGAENTRFYQGVTLNKQEHEFFAKKWGELNVKRVKPLLSLSRFKTGSTTPENMQAKELKAAVLGMREMALGLTLLKFERINAEIMTLGGEKGEQVKQSNSLNNLQGIFTSKQ